MSDAPPPRQRPDATAATPVPARVSVARQPVFDAKLQVLAWELLYRDAPGSEEARIEDGSVATARVAIAALMDIGLERLAGQAPVHVNVPEALVRRAAEFPLPLPPSRVVLEVLEDVRADDEVLAGLRLLKAAGYRLALDDFTSADADERLLALADSVKVDLLAEPAATLESTAKSLRARGLELIAEKVETREQFERCVALGFTGFQGYFLQRPETFTGQRAPALRLPAMQVMAALQQPDYTVEQLERLVSQDLGLVHRLLRCLNSGYYNLPRRVTSIRQAIVALGRENLLRLCAAVALAEFRDRPDWLLVNALVRARMCELLAPQAGRESSGFFFAGLLSHLDALLGLPTPKAIGDLPLTPTVERALVAGAGPIGAALRAILDWEQGRFEACRAAGLDEGQLRRAYLEAVEWAEQVRPLLKA
ncbi:MAG: HDOD domain-containing protein [Steroidobacteraceae bacterium]|jgi:EAL and modified HD-GYP domain-containing signal transduction protein|nr:HDOD domain-containing protein [Steroidobacteraceae bacterium]